MMLLDLLAKIEDPRSYHGKEYKLHHILFIAILAVLNKAKSYADIHRFLVVHEDKFRKLRKLKWRRLPDESALRRIIICTPIDEIERVLRLYSAQLVAQKASPEGLQQMCFDGKVLRVSFRHNQRGQRVFEAFSALDGLILAHIPLNSAKDSDIPAMAECLQSMDLDGVVVTADAMHCQKKL